VKYVHDGKLIEVYDCSLCQNLSKQRKSFEGAIAKIKGAVYGTLIKNTMTP